MTIGPASYLNGSISDEVYLYGGRVGRPPASGFTGQGLVPASYIFRRMAVDVSGRDKRGLSRLVAR